MMPTKPMGNETHLCKILQYNEKIKKGDENKNLCVSTGGAEGFQIKTNGSPQLGAKWY